MANITSFPDHFQGELETVAIPNPKLAQSLNSTGLVISLSEAIQYPDATIPTKAMVIVIRNAITGYPEMIYVPAGGLSADGKTITLTSTAQRGINPSETSTGEVDYESGLAARVPSNHPQGSEVRISISPLDFKAMTKALKGEINSGGTQWKVGRGVAEDITVFAANGTANEPFWIYSNATGQWLYSNDGVSSTPFGTGAGVTGGDGVTVTAGVIAVDRTDTTTFVSTSSGAADVGKVALLNSVGQIPDGFIASFPGEIRMYGGAAAPTGFLLCDATAVSRTTYAALFAVIGTTYGVGDGSTTFNLPDGRGRSAIGSGTGDAADATAHTLGSKTGTETHTLLTAEMPAHTHTATQQFGPGGDTTLGLATYDSGGFNYNKTLQSTYHDNTGGGGAHNNMQPSFTVNYIIKT